MRRLGPGSTFAADQPHDLDETYSLRGRLYHAWFPGGQVWWVIS